MSDSTSPVPEESADLGRLLVSRGLVRQEAVDAALKLQRELTSTGKDRVPRLGELLVLWGHLSNQQVLDALAEQSIRILWCPRCSVCINVRQRADVDSYKCARCETALVAPPADTLTASESAIMLVSREPLPADVEEAAKDPANKFGKYILLNELGRGAVGVVHRAWDTYLHQPVALKRIRPPSGVPNPGDLWRETRVVSLLREARSAVRLRHPNIVPIYDVDRVGRDYYISMEFVEGCTVSELVRRARDRGQLSPYFENPKRWIHTLRDVARALHYAHTRPNPVIHCDLKPSNILIDPDGRAFVLDFGLARELRSPSTAGAVSGTPSYMAPEQASGRSDEIDPRTDVYGLGAILYELLTGRPPFVGEIFDVMENVVKNRPQKPSDIVDAHPSRVTEGSTARLMRVPRALEEVCLKCLEKDRANRFQSARDVIDALDRVVGGPRTSRLAKAAAPPPAPAPAPPLPPPPAARRSALPILAAILGLSIAAVAVGVTVLAPRSTQSLAEVRASRLKYDMDAQCAAFRPDLALQGYQAYSPTLAGTALQSDVELAVTEVEWISRLQSRLVDAINRDKPKRPAFALRNRKLAAIEILQASRESIVVMVGGAPDAIPWSSVDPLEVAALAKSLLPSMEPSDRYGLGLFLHKNGIGVDARE